MKKFLLTLAVVASALSATAQSTQKLTVITPNQWWGSKDVTTSTAGKVNYDSQYGQFNIKQNLGLDSYTGMIITYKDAKDVQVKIQGDAADETTYSKKAEVYLALEGEAGEQTFEFPASLGTKIEDLALQGLNPGATITFDKIILLKGEEKETVTEFAGMSWGGSFTKLAAAGTDILITDDYGEIGFKEAVNYEAGKAYTYDVTFSEPTPALLQFKVLTNAEAPGATLSDYDSKYYVYKDIPAGSTSASIIVNYAYEAITLPCPTKENTFRGIQATVTVTEASAISTPSATIAAPMYNLNGQRIASPKGIYIQNGKKYIAQ